MFRMPGIQQTRVTHGDGQKGMLACVDVSTATMVMWNEIPQKIENDSTTWSSSFTFGYISKVSKNHYLKKDICTPVFTAELFTLAKTWNQRMCS